MNNITSLNFVELQDCISTSFAGVMHLIETDILLDRAIITAVEVFEGEEYEQNFIYIKREDCYSIEFVPDVIDVMYFIDTPDYLLMEMIPINCTYEICYSDLKDYKRGSAVKKQEASKEKFKLSECSTEEEIAIAIKQILRGNTHE